MVEAFIAINIKRYRNYKRYPIFTYRNAPFKGNSKVAANLSAIKRSALKPF
jgi:hypothetical protein